MEKRHFSFITMFLAYFNLFTFILLREKKDGYFSCTTLFQRSRDLFGAKAIKQKNQQHYLRILLKEG